MNKILMAMSLLIVLPSFATCSIDGTTVCSLPGFREQIPQVYSPNSNINVFSGSPEARLKPATRNEIKEELRHFAPVENDYSYNSSCQFGVCMKGGDSLLFKPQKQ